MTAVDRYGDMVARLDALLERKSADEAVDRARQAMRKKPKRPEVNASGREGGRRGRGVEKTLHYSPNLQAQHPDAATP